MDTAYTNIIVGVPYSDIRGLVKRLVNRILYIVDLVGEAEYLHDGTCVLLQTYRKDDGANRSKLVFSILCVAHKEERKTSVMIFAESGGDAIIHTEKRLIEKIEQSMQDFLPGDV